MKPNIGRVSYNVRINCPQCREPLDLNEWPYNDEENEEYGAAEDRLGLAVFGTEKEPATWKDLNIEYKCLFCETVFNLNELEI